ncbi:Piso0_003818 [Millerozyma farinosa CBS 7064]|uniref:Piso0_003818 protein n=1 Tax=Pichia sorbitophila (strain ATCC MYA-4447 / BCRC 22081 / CBS 7064 / NBRC 10061 / NRRL Y-12695) TaxID=559304 RepID=G8Y8E0_PICSO|nr:Piso0_003818 [Millerozyma farinosa CBS 7064]CCE84277.1 Piso0_003818 [Millerozyma farinosa CBS 7064]
MDLGARVYLRGRTSCAAVSCRPGPFGRQTSGHVICVTCDNHRRAGHVYLVVCTHALATPHVICQLGTQRKNVCSRAGASVRRYRSDQIKPITGMIVANERWVNE